MLEYQVSPREPSHIARELLGGFGYQLVTYPHQKSKKLQIFYFSEDSDFLLKVTQDIHCEYLTSRLAKTNMKPKIHYSAYSYRQSVIS